MVNYKLVKKYFLLFIPACPPVIFTECLFILEWKIFFFYPRDVKQQTFHALEFIAPVEAPERSIF